MREPSLCTEHVKDTTLHLYRDQYPFEAVAINLHPHRNLTSLPSLIGLLSNLFSLSFRVDAIIQTVPVLHFVHLST